jgi:hypothetical protein
MSFDKDAIKGNLKKQLSLNPLEGIKAAHDPDPGKVFKTGRSAAKRAQERQSLLIEKQRQKTELDLAESNDEIARRKALAKSGKGGRQSLIQTSETGSTNLGGT